MSALVLLHGFAGHSDSWDAVLDFRGRDRRMALRPLLLGHDPLGEPEALPQSFTKEVDRLAALLPTGQGALHLCGYSLGARVALGLLCRHPGRFASATLLSVHPGLGDGSQREARAHADEEWALLLEREGIAPFTDAWEAQPLFASQRRLPAELLLQQRWRRLRHRPEGLALALRTLSLSRMPDYTSALAQRSARLPVHLMAGAEDDKFRELAARLLPRLTGARLTVVPCVGHNLLLEAPAAVAAALDFEKCP